MIANINEEAADEIYVSLRKRQKMKKVLYILFILFCTAGCTHLTEYDVVGGNLNKSVINSMCGFYDKIDRYLNEYNLTYSQFILMSTDSAWALPSSTQTTLHNFREGLEKPTSRTLFQKVIPLSEMETYLNNIYGGTIGGFISFSADVKNLYTMYDIYWGLRLDYEGTRFKENAAGYAVLRFYTDQTAYIQIPFCQELGGDYPHSWPNGGGGFTTSTLGKGGYPEWRLTAYIEPCDGAELYEMNSNGYEILRGVFTAKNKWETVDKGYSPRSKSPAQPYRQKTVTYLGHEFILRATINGICHLATFTYYPNMNLKVLEKGIWGIEVPQAECTSE